MKNLPKSIEEAQEKAIRLVDKYFSSVVSFQDEPTALRTLEELRELIKETYQSALNDARERLLKEMPMGIYNKVLSGDDWDNPQRTTGYNIATNECREAIDRVFKLLEE